jgi:three-Cys-motif partner protein
MESDSGTNERKKPSENIETAPLFPDLQVGPGRKVRRYKRIERPIWTANKAQFIRQYLAYFVQVTHHGAYIDGFAGPQSFRHLEDWCASLVLRSEPKWLRDFFLCEITKKGVRALKKLQKEQREARDKKGRKIKRNIEVVHGDFNVEVSRILGSGKISQKEATFCLLDQRTFECHWSTVKKLAEYKTGGENKIELLYFLGVGWLQRAFSGIRKTEKMVKWWGASDWRKLIGMRSYDIAELVRRRFQKELGYKYVAAYPIVDADHGNRVMYYMIHASDHDEAPALMVRAHHKAVKSLPRERQEKLFKEPLL